MATLALGQELETRSETLVLRLDEADLQTLRVINANLTHLRNLLALAIEFSGESGPVDDSRNVGPRRVGVSPSDAFRVRRVRYGSTFEVYIELVQTYGPQLLTGSATVATLFGSIAGGRLVWKKGNQAQSVANKTQAEADALNESTAAAKESRKERAEKRYGLPEDTRLLVQSLNELPPEQVKVVVEWLAEARSVADVNIRRFGGPRGYAATPAKAVVNPRLNQLKSLLALTKKKQASFTIEDK